MHDRISAPAMLLMLRRLRVVFLVFLHLLAILWGVHSTAADGAGDVSFLFSLIAAWAVVTLCVHDSRIRNTPFAHILQFIMFGTWTVSAPIYLIWSRGWRGILWALLWSISLLICILVGGALGGIFRIAMQ